MQKNKKILMVAFHFPPYRMSSGIQRTLKFSTYLREYGWDPMILSISPRAYDVVNPDQLKEIPEDVIVERAWGLDTARQLSFRGKYLRWMAQPDRWASWWLGGMRTGMQMIRKHRPDVLFSTFPIATAHMIGLGLSKRSGLPWVADFRDAMTEEGYPRDPLTWRVQRKLEAASVEQCTKALFTTQLTREMYAERYPNIAESRWGVVENGYDEDNFLDALTDIEDAPLGKPNQITLVHSGILYPKERDPRPFFAAIAGLKREGVISADTLQVILRATGSDDLYRPQLISHGIDDIVRLEPVVAYRDALREMLRADGLLLFQGSVCNHQIPAKIYEYYRTGKPIFALVDFDGISAKMLDETGGAHLVDMAEVTSIACGLKDFIQKLHSGDCAGVSRSFASAHSRKARTFELARVLDEIVDSRKIIA